MPELPQPDLPATLVDRIELLEARVAALEDVLDQTRPDTTSEVLAKLEWAVAHGRKRPW